ncbi:MAG: glycosyltransferase family 39 protein [Chitinophagales bacterium]|nr:glycosyltransferase family 39 protein [Chitinophagales bacterium]
MSQKKISPRKPGTVSKPKVTQSNTKSLFDWTEENLGKHDLKIFGVIAVFSALLIFLLFDLKISIGHDDALYLEGGYKYAQDFFGYFYSANAPLYVLFLSLPIKLFGLNLFLLKMFSVVFFLAALWITYRSFRGRIPYIVLFFALIIFATNYAYLQYASLTYTECFFACVQAIFLGYFFRLIFKTDEYNWKTIQENWKDWLLMGFWLWVIITTRSVATFAVFAVLAYFILQKKWWAIPTSLISLAIFWIPWEIAKRVLWAGIETNQYASQSKTLTVTGSSATDASETLSGYISRFFENTEIYLSARLWEILGFRPENSPNDIKLTIFTVVIILLGLFFAFRNKNKPMLFTIIYFGTLLAGTFVMLQTFWGQARLVMVYLPYILMALFYGFYSLFNMNGLKILQPLIFIPFLVIWGKGMGVTFQKAIKNQPIVSKNLKGDKYAGYSPDYVNYFKMSEYCADSLPKGTWVAVRKAPMSFVYGKGKYFYAVYDVPSENADTLLALWKKDNVQYVIRAPLRNNPYLPLDNPYTGKVQYYMELIKNKYPSTFSLEKTIGDQEAAELYKINYPDSLKVVLK